MKNLSIKDIALIVASSLVIILLAALMLYPNSDEQELKRQVKEKQDKIEDLERQRIILANQSKSLSKGLIEMSKERQELKDSIKQKDLKLNLLKQKIKENESKEPDINLSPSDIDSTFLRLINGG